VSENGGVTRGGESARLAPLPPAQVALPYVEYIASDIVL
jgi:hypothetical protein